MEAQRRTEIQRLRSMRWRKSLRKKELRPRSFRWAVNRSGAVLPVDSVLKKADVDDLVNQTAEKFKECDGLVVGSPVYYASANATLVAFLTRLFYSTHFDKTMKVGAAVAVARRGGLSSTFDELNKFFTISGMPVASSQYWNSIHGAAPGEALKDAEGLQIMRTLAKNMSFLIKSIQLGKEEYGLPEKESPARTNFVR